MYVEGVCDPKFEAVRAAFVRNFTHENESGAAVAIEIGGERVVDLWGGLADEVTGKKWGENTLCGFYSTGKPLAAIGLLQMVDQGRIRLDDSVKDVWPEFGVKGKETVTYRQLLCHQAGLPAIRNAMPAGAMYDWNKIVGELAGQQPWWEPGTKHVYHTNTYGYLVGEPVRKLTGLAPTEYIISKIGAPLNEEIYFGVPDEALDRVATLIWESCGAVADPSRLDGPMPEEKKMLLSAVANPPGFSSQGVMNTRKWRQAAVPSTNGHGTARGVASVYSILARGGSTDKLTIVSESLLKEATSTQSEGHCPALGRTVSFGLGFQLARPERPMGPNPRSYGHFGTGGSLGFADPQAKVGFGYVMNRVKPRWQNPRNKALIAALYSCL